MTGVTISFILTTCPLFSDIPKEKQASTSKPSDRSRILAWVACDTVIVLPAEETVGTTDYRGIDETCVRVHGTVTQELAASDRNENVKRLDKAIVAILQLSFRRSP